MRSCSKSWINCGKVQESKNCMVKSWRKRKAPNDSIERGIFFCPPSSISHRDWYPAAVAIDRFWIKGLPVLHYTQGSHLPRMHLLPGMSPGDVSCLQLPLHSVSSLASRWIFHTDDKQSLLVTFRPANVSTAPYSGPYVPLYIAYIWKIKSLKK